MNTVIAGIMSFVIAIFPTTNTPDHLVTQFDVESYSKFEKNQKKNQRLPRVRCDNQLYQWLYSAGFRGHNIREAWAIAMRESNGRPGTISNSDYGLFQFNYPSWGGKSWWNTQLLLTPEYNAKIAYQLSNGGRNWQPWGMADHNQFNFANYGMWSDWQLYNWIVEPYQRYYAQYPC